MTPREFAVEAIEKLQAAGFEALWAGGCVRDQLLNLSPKDYDIATNATPDQVRSVFGQRRTLPIGAAFGVITVLGPRTAGQIEVATFRRDTGYSDGRHPDSVQFTDAREDAIRRDFTINGIFYDPIKEQVIDFVGGQEDLQAKIIRAIGNPHERIDEDKLRMLRGVRFAATFAFELDPETLAAIQEHAAEIQVVSEERIGTELVRMLSHPYRTIAARLLIKSNLLVEVLPTEWLQFHPWDDEEWEQRLAELERLESTRFEAVAAVLLRSYLEDKKGAEALQSGQRKRRFSLASHLQSAWRLTNDQRDAIQWITRHWRTLAAAEQKRWSEIQPLLIHDHAETALDVATAIEGSTDGVRFCRERLKWTPIELDPPRLIDGKDLIELGVEKGPHFRAVLERVRAAQLDGKISTSEEALSMVENHSG